MELALLLLTVAGGLGGLFLLLRAQLRNQKLAEAADAPGAEGCVACGGRELVELAPQAHRCKTCGFESGDGLAAWKKSARIEAAKKLSPEQLKLSALGDLRQARTQLLAAEAMFGVARERLYATIANPGGMGAFDEVGQEFSRVMRELHEARALAESAAIKLDAPELSRALPELSAADFNTRYDLSAFDKAGALMNELRVQVDRALSRHE